MCIARIWGQRYRLQAGYLRKARVLARLAAPEDGSKELGRMGELNIAIPRGCQPGEVREGLPQTRLLMGTRDPGPKRHRKPGAGDDHQGPSYAV